MRLAAALLTAMLATGCKGPPVDGASASASASSSAAPLDVGSAAPPPSASATATAAATNKPSLPPLDAAAEKKLADETKACAALRTSTLAEASLPGAATYEKERLYFARVRGRALLWRKVPGELSKELADKIASLTKKQKVLDAVRLVEKKQKDPAARRAAFLREGYLFADDVELALALVEQLSLAELFAEPTVYLQRGVEVYELERREKSRWFPERYLYKDGPYAGMAAELLLGDRVSATKEDLGVASALAIDLRDLADQAAFDRIKPLHLSDKHLVAELRYGPDVWVPAVIELAGGKAKVACEELTPELDLKRRTFIAEREPLTATMNRLRGVVRAMVKEELPFDAAPDQGNGALKREWKKAYLQGKLKYESGGRTFPIYTLEGRPKPPQVCIDFLTDVWERASGTWYDPAEVVEPYGAHPKVTPHPKANEGGINFDRMKIKNRRSVAKFERFTLKNEELFDVWQLPKKEKVKFEDRREFFDYLRDKADMFHVGDMVIIHGFKEGGRPHYHSLLVTETDPITGVISLIASNAVKPREQTLEGIMHISPERTIRTRIRVRQPWLELVKQAVDKPL